MAFSRGPTKKRVRTLSVVLVIHEIFGPDAHIQDVCRRITGVRVRGGRAEPLCRRGLGRLLTPANIALAMQAFAQASPDSAAIPRSSRRSPRRSPPSADRSWKRSVECPRRRPSRASPRTSSPSPPIELPRVDPQKVGVVGFCFGGTMAAAWRPPIRTCRGRGDLLRPEPPTGRRAADPRAGARSLRERGPGDHLHRPPVRRRDGGYGEVVRVPRLSPARSMRSSTILDRTTAG